MRVLILILANDGPLYSELQKAWRKYMTDDCFFLKANPEQAEEFIVADKTLWIKTQEGHLENDAIWQKTIRAFRYFSDYDYIFRTNLSSFIRIPELIAYCATLPKSCCAGHPLDAYGVRFPSGCGYIISMDLAKRIAENPPNHFVIDDVTMGVALKNLGVDILEFPIQAVQPQNLHAPDTTSMKEFMKILDSPTAWHYRIRTADPGRIERDLHMHRLLYNRFYRPRVAVCYWGQLRTFKETYASHKKYLLDLLDYDIHIYIHTWENQDLSLDYPSTVIVEDQQPVKDAVKSRFHEYFDLDTYMDNRGDSCREWHPWMVRNLLYSLESQRRVTEAIKPCDYVIFIRPDLELHSPFTGLSQIKEKMICVLDHDDSTNNCGMGLNDRFAVMRYEDRRHYGCRIEGAATYRRVGRLAAEHYLYNHVKKHFTITYTDMKTSLNR